MHRLFPVLIATVFSGLVNAQDSIAVFNVVKSKTNFIISPSGNVLWIGVDNRICIKTEGTGKIAKLEIAGATISQKDSCYIARVTSGSGHEAILSVYELLPNGKSQLALNKKYNLVSLPVPEVLVCDVKSDSTIDKFSLMAIGKLTAKLRGTNEKLKVISFEMQTGNQATIDTLKSTNEKLTVEMKQVIDAMKPGGLIMFNNIICRNAKGDLLPPVSVRIFLDKKEIYQYGF
ncbi:MAG: hypothetical protein AB7G44_16090 [Bacteroidia bacterium]